MLKRVSALILCLLAVCGLPAAAQEDRSETQILIIVGPSNHPPGTHEVAAGARLMQYCLVHSDVPGLSVTVVEGWPKEEVLLDGADTVVFIGDSFPANRLPGKEAILAKLGAMMDRVVGHPGSITPPLGILISVSPPESNDQEFANSSSGAARSALRAAATFASNRSRIACRVSKFGAW